MLKWKGLRLKLISDMKRYEGLEDNRIENTRAGIDLLVRLYGQHGVTAKTLIFCGDEARARKLAEQ